MVVRIGILGAGAMGRRHLTNARETIPESEVTAICDPRLADSSDFQKTLGPAAVEFLTGDEEAFWRRPFDAVVISTPSDQHGRQAERAASLGRAIFCEKPLEADRARHRALWARMEESGVPFQIGFNRRFDRDFALIGREVAAGAIGRPHLVRITSRDPAPPPADDRRRCGGLFFDMAIHDFDMARFVMGTEVQEVFARGAALVEPEIAGEGDVDTAVITLSFQGGAMGVIDSSRRATHGYDQRLEVFGEKGSLRCGHRGPTSVWHGSESGRLSPELHPFDLEPYEDAYAAELRAFVAAVGTGAAPSPSIADSWQALLLAEAAQLSWREERAVRVQELL